jgi:hypothetical protein
MELRNLKDEIKKQIPSIIKQVNANILDSPQLRILRSQHLDKFWTKRPNKMEMFVFAIKQEMIENIDFKMVAQSLDNQIPKALNSHNLLYVDEKFTVLSAERIQNHQDKCRDLSLEGYYTFFFGRLGIDLFINGVHQIRTNVFYSEEDLQRYAEKYDISQIYEVFKVYQARLNRQHEQVYFFADRATLTQIDPKFIGKNILKNKPEKFMRDHLKTFLQDHVRHTFLIENELATSKRKLDIYTEVSGQFYFFEIKWLGCSIDDCGTKIGQPYGEPRAREGVVQILEYIRELIEDMHFNVKCGYLVIFDSRIEKTDIDYKNFKFVRPELIKYMAYFNKLEHLILENKHPA